MRVLWDSRPPERFRVKSAVMIQVSRKDRPGGNPVSYQGSEWRPDLFCLKLQGCPLMLLRQVQSHVPVKYLSHVWTMLAEI